MSYDLKPISAPRLEGSRLLFAAWLLEHGTTGRRLAPTFFHSLGIDRFRELRLKETPLYTPLVAGPGDAPTADSSAPHLAPDIEILEKIGTTIRPDGGYTFPSVGDYARAYRDGSLSPETVAQRVIHVLEHQDRGDPPLYAFISWRGESIRRQAQESAERFAAGTPRSILEGVPIAVKDEIDVAEHCTSLGTSFLNQETAAQDAWVVARLREAGAMIIGKTNMHEIGIGVTGLNPFHGTPVNPYAPWRYPGGSSSGSATSVAAGITPVAIGADGGGSIRIPSAYCGVFGLKLTMGRTSASGEYPLAPSVGNAGPIAGNVRDLALTYLVMSGPDPKDEQSLRQPTPNLDGFLSDVEGLKIGVYEEWFHDARHEVVATTTALLEELEKRGAQIVPVTIPELDSLRMALLVTITSEMRHALETAYRDHRSDFGNEARANLALARYITTSDYIKAQQVRRRMLGHFERAFDTVDLIATPTTANLPPRLNRERLLSGISDLKSLSETMRYAVAANMLGYPAVSVPAGFVTARSRHFWNTVEEKDEDGNVYSQVPVGLQFMARHWQEALLLRTARVCEEIVIRPRPRVYLSPYEARNPIESGHETPRNEE
jgi:Asp-tRNA(Asn)/Glu-tRNA(Gln) amidotransferase A subunit family amidase